MKYNLKNWSKLTKYQRNYVCIYQKLSPAFITKHWSKLTEYQRDYVCINQKLSLSFIQKHWSKLTEWQRSCVCKYQDYTPTSETIDLTPDVADENTVNGSPSLSVSSKQLILTRWPRLIDMSFGDF